MTRDNSSKQQRTPQNKLAHGSPDQDVCPMGKCFQSCDSSSKFTGTFTVQVQLRNIISVVVISVSLRRSSYHCVGCLIHSASAGDLQTKYHSLKHKSFTSCYRYQLSGFETKQGKINDYLFTANIFYYIQVYIISCIKTDFFILQIDLIFQLWYKATGYQVKLQKSECTLNTRNKIFAFVCVYTKYSSLYTR